MYFIHSMCLIVLFHFLSGIYCYTTFTVTIEWSSRHPDYTLSPSDEFPKEVEIKVTSTLRQHTFQLVKRENHNEALSILTQVGPENSHRYAEHFHLYEGKQSSFILQAENNKIVYCTGMFEDVGYTYTIYTVNSNRSMQQFIMVRYTKPKPLRVHEATTRTQQTGIPGQLKLTKLHFGLVDKVTRSNRRARQIQLYEIELLIVMDFALFNQLRRNAEQYGSTTEENIRQKIVQEIMLIVNGMDTRFRNIKGGNYMVDIVLAGIYIGQNASMSPWSENVKKRSKTRSIINEEALELFIEWTKMNQDILPEYDHAMAITAYNLRNKDNHKTLGLGYKQSLCTDRRYSIIEHHGNTAYVSYIATHELAHSLGAKHDGHPVTVSYGDKTKSCQDDDGFIMGTTASKIPDDLDRSWSFSECSQLYFDFFIDYLNANRTNCMTSTNRHIATSQERVPMATRYSPDEQCTRAHGVGFVLDRTYLQKGTSDICRSIPCKRAGTRDHVPTLPLAGTRCGTGKICHLGKCIEEQLHDGSGKGIAKDDGTCVFGDQPGILRTDGLTCQQLTHLKYAHECYTYGAECCATCRFHRRQNPNITNCHYGDRKASCSARDCDDVTCCETCALLQGLLPECQPPVMNKNLMVIYNTKSFHHGTTAMFSCSPGFILIGNETTVCVDGVWSSTSPQCVRGCRKPVFQEIAHAQLSFSDVPDSVLRIMDKIHFKCLNGFVLKGPDHLQCLSNSTWNGELPTCSLEFSSSTTINVLENTLSGNVIHTLATGNASSHFRQLHFSHPGLKVTEDGRVLVDDGHVIDYEHVLTYTIVVEATSVVDTRIKVKQRLTVTVVDVNEFPPKFDEDHICIEMTHTYHADSFTKRVHATDLDLYSTNITYELERSLDYAVIDHVTGNITFSSAFFLNQPKTSNLLFEVYATDAGSPELTGTCTIEVRIGTACVRSNSAANCAHIYAIFYLVYFSIYFYISLVKI